MALVETESLRSVTVLCGLKFLQPSRTLGFARKIRLDWMRRLYSNIELVSVIELNSIQLKISITHRNRSARYNIDVRGSI